VGIATLLPAFSHVRHVGARRAITEPSAVTVILGFYILVFPLRGVVIAASGYSDVFLARHPVSAHDLVIELMLASLATTALFETYYATVGRRSVRGGTATVSESGEASRRGVLLLATGLGAAALLSLLGVLVHYGGLAGAQAAFLSHSKAAALQGATTASASAWTILAAPAVWCGACIAVDAVRARGARVLACAEIAIIVAAQLVVFGSRLNAILALLGAWVVFYYSGRRIPVRTVLVAVPLIVLVSVPIVSQRPGGNGAHLSSLERYSRIAGYGVLDTSLAVRQEPQAIAGKLTQPSRWFDLPAYFVPSFLWHGRPNLATRRLDLYVAQTLGTANDQTTGFPASYITEAWLYGGWPAVLLLSVVFGAILGWLHRRLITARDARPEAAALLTYCFIVTVGFTYYKDGDALAWLVGNWRAAAYLGVAMLATGVWQPFGGRPRRTAVEEASSYSRPVLGRSSP
jgi:hypothetical protein